MIKGFNASAALDRLAYWAGRMAAQRHLTAIREGFIFLMPLIIAASFFVLINNVVLNEKAGLMGLLGIKADWLVPAREIGIRIYNGTLNILTLLATAMIAWRMALAREQAGAIHAVFALACLVIFFPLEQTLQMADQIVRVPGLIAASETAASGLFVGIIIALISSELLTLAQRSRYLAIRMPDSVPPAVASSFNVILPMLLLLTLFGLLAVLIEVCFGTNLHHLVNEVVQAPLQNALQSLHGVLGLLFSMNMLWFFGIHGVSIMMPITEPTLLVAIQENAAALQQGAVPPHIVTKPFIDAFGYMGGGGQTIGLVIAMLIASRREDHRTITRLSGVPSLFNINESMIFGIPIIFNPLLLVPFILTPLLSVGIAWFATALELIDKTTVLIPWTTPPVLSAFLATGGDWRAALLALLLLILSVLIYLPFVLALNRQKQAEQGA